MDRIDEITERRREEIEAKIRRIYSKAASETAEKNARFYARLKEKAAKKLEKVNAGEITMAEFQEWLQRQMVTGKINEDHMAAMAARLTDANTTAAAYVNGETPSILAENYNWSAYGFETTYGNLSFSLYDEDTVRRLIAEDPDILPPVSVDVPIDKRWNRDKIRDEIISAILQGKSIPEIADSIRSVAKMDEAAGIRNARTAITGAQNAGRQASYERAAAMGIQVTKRWMAAMDGRTRDSHRHMDGVEVPYNKPFVTPLGSVMMYPGDINGKAGDIYNCRCTMRTVEKPGIEAEARTRRVRDPHTGKNVVVSDMTYSQWGKWKESKNRNTDIGLQFFAKVDPRKLTKYALDPENGSGKAQGFEKALGYTKSSADALIQDIQNHFSVDIKIAVAYNNIRGGACSSSGLTLKSDMLVDHVIDRWRTTLKSDIFIGSWPIVGRQH